MKNFDQDVHSNRHRVCVPVLLLIGVCSMIVAVATAIPGKVRAAGSKLIRVTKIEPQSDEIRIDYLRQSRLWTDIDTSELNMLVGPEGPRQFAFNEEVTCKYHTPGRELGGATPKFLCEIDGAVYMVKYLPDRSPSSNRETFAEIAATRLFWALGFGADRAYPVRILCRGCPANPRSGPNQEERRSGRYKNRVRRLGIALIEVRYEGVTIECDSGQGWTWSELDREVGTYRPHEPRSDKRYAELAEIRKHVEALKLLQVFVQHGDCKPKQQRLVCLPDGVVPENTSIPADEEEEDLDESEEGVIADRDGTSCRQSFMFVDDLGATFGGAGNMTKSSAKMDLGHWAEKEIFDLDHYERTNGQCKGVLNTSSSCSGGLENPIITETGRRFLLERLNRLTDLQIRDIFIAARVDQLDKDLERRYDEGGLYAWVEAFKKKVQQIATHPCRDP